MTERLTDREIEYMAGEYIAEDWTPDRYYRSMNIIAFARNVESAVLARAAIPAVQRIDPEALILACVPGGYSCDPQAVADAIRAYFAAHEFGPGLGKPHKVQDAAKLPADDVPASEWSGTTEPKLLWCRQCGEGVQPGLCRRPNGTEQPAECAAIVGVTVGRHQVQDRKGTHDE